MRRHVNIVYTPIMHICESQFRFVEVLLYDCTDAAREIAAETTAGKKRYITKAGALQIQVKRLAELKKKNCC